MCVCVVGCWCAWAHIIVNWVLTCYKLFLIFTQCLYTETVEVLYSQTFCIIIVKKWFYSMASRSVPYTCPIGCIRFCWHFTASDVFWGGACIPYTRQLQWFCLIWIWWPSCTLGMKGAWKMSLGAEGCANSLHGKAEGARSWTVILICVLLQRLTDESLIIYSCNT